jgi:hypothetical protein
VPLALRNCKFGASRKLFAIVTHTPWLELGSLAYTMMIGRLWIVTSTILGPQEFWLFACKQPLRIHAIRMSQGQRQQLDNRPPPLNIQANALLCNTQAVSHFLLTVTQIAQKSLKSLACSHGTTTMLYILLPEHNIVVTFSTGHVKGNRITPSIQKPSG